MFRLDGYEWCGRRGQGYKLLGCPCTKSRTVLDNAGRDPRKATANIILCNDDLEG